MELFEAEALILADSGTVWDIITDQGNYQVWDFGMTQISGQVSHGQTIRISTRSGGKRPFRLRVHQVPGQLMTWSGKLPLGLLKVERTFTLTDHTGFTHLSVRDTASGPLRGLVRTPVSGTRRFLPRYVEAIKFRAELLGFHLKGGIFPAAPATAAARRVPQLAR